MKVAYRPSGNLSLRDFHHAVNNLPADAFVPEFNNNIAVSCCGNWFSLLLDVDYLLNTRTLLNVLLMALFTCLL